MTRSEALDIASGFSQNAKYSDFYALLSRIYRDFEEQLNMEKREAYLNGSNDCFKALKEAGKLK